MQNRKRQMIALTSMPLCCISVYLQCSLFGKSVVHEYKRRSVTRISRFRSTWPGSGKPSVRRNPVPNNPARSAYTDYWSSSAASVAGSAGICHNRSLRCRKRLQWNCRFLLFQIGYSMRHVWLFRTLSAGRPVRLLPASAALAADAECVCAAIREPADEILPVFAFSM